jgi:Domain of unknown function (DUF1963)
MTPKPTRPTLETIRNAFAAAGFGEYWEDFAKVIRPAIGINTTDLEWSAESQIPIGASKFGGLPDVPFDFSIPHDERGVPCSFVAQIDLAQVSKFDAESLLPKTGLLSFFASEYDYSEGKINGNPVFYFSEGASLLRRKEQEVGYLARLQQISFFGGWSITDDFGEGLSIIKDFDEESRFNDLYSLGDDSIQLNTGVTHLLGYPDYYFGMFADECELLRRGILTKQWEPQDWHQQHKDLLISVRKQAFHDWICLLEEGNFTGNIFNLNYMIYRDDLAAQDFTKVVCIATR